MVSLKENKWLMKGVFELLKHMVVRETTKWLKPGTKRLVVGIGCENMKWMQKKKVEWLLEAVGKNVHKISDKQVVKSEHVSQELCERKVAVW